MELKTPLMTLNKHELWQIKNYATQHGLRFRFDATLVPRYDGCLRPCELRVDPVEAIQHFESQDPTVRSIYQQWWELRSPTKRPGFIFNCNYGGSFHVNPYGRLQFCGQLNSPNADLRRVKFKDSWYQLHTQVREQRYQHDQTCTTCRCYEYCTNCPAIAASETGDQRKPVPYYCQLATQRAVAFSRQPVNNRKGVEIWMM